MTDDIELPARSEARLSGTEIEITEAMIAAGAEVFSGREMFADEARWLAKHVLEAALAEMVSA